jgi:hypothetical protein
LFCSGQAAIFTGITRAVNRVSEIPFSSADANRIFDKRPMNLTLLFRAKAKCVKISRAMRESHASAKKLFAKRLLTEGTEFSESKNGKGNRVQIF